MIFPLMNYYDAITTKSYILVYVIQLKAIRILWLALHLRNFCDFMTAFTICSALALYRITLVWYDERTKLLIFIATERQKHGYKGAKSCRFRGRVYY